MGKFVLTQEEIDKYMPLLIIAVDNGSNTVKDMSQSIGISYRHVKELLRITDDIIRIPILGKMNSCKYHLTTIIKEVK